MDVKFSNDLFLGSAELNRFKLALTDEGYKFDLQAKTFQYGIIKNKVIDPNFNYFKVGTNSAGTIFLNEGYAFDSDFNIIHQNALQANISLVTANVWQWVKIAYKTSVIEKGTVSIGGTNKGLMTGVGTEFTKILRGQPNYPSKISFVNSTNYNTLEYEILEVIDDTNAVVQGVFDNVETGLQISIVGTFTAGYQPQSGEKNPFQYDDCLVTLVPETVTNTAPSGLVSGSEFYVCRVMNSSTNGVIIQDKRSLYLYKNLENDDLVDIDNTDNPLIGVENVKFDHPFTPEYKNIVEVAWAYRTQAWVINTSTNVITLSSGLGGKYKTNADFVNGDFNGWRCYAPDGTYSIILNSVKTGSAINLTVDSFDVNSYSNDGGITFLTTEFIKIAPNCDEIEIVFTPNPADNVSTQKQIFEFEINKEIGRCDVLCYGDPSCSYVVTYRYKNFKTYSSEKLIPSDTVHGYYNESSFDSTGNILFPSQTTKVTYTSSLVTGFIILELAANAYKNFAFKVDKGDLKGVNQVTSLSGITDINLVVGTSLNYLLFTGTIVLTNNVNINLSDSNLVDGNEFRIQFNCTSFTLNGFKIRINLKTSSSSSLLKELGQGDIYTMLNTENGIVVDAVSDGTSWFLSQNYDLGMPFENKFCSRLNYETNFDSAGLGKIRGLFGWGLADGVTTDGINTTDDLQSLFIVGRNPSDSNYANIGDTGGESHVTLTVNEMPSHTHTQEWLSGSGGADGSGGNLVDGHQNTSSTGGDQPHENRPPYYTVLMIQKLF